MLCIQNTLWEGDAQNVKDSRMLMPKTRGCRKRCDRVTSNQNMTWKHLYGLETPNECFVLKTRNSETCIYLANNSYLSVNILLDKVSPLFVQEFFFVYHVFHKLCKHRVQIYNWAQNCVGCSCKRDYNVFILWLKNNPFYSQNRE